MNGTEAEDGVSKRLYRCANQLSIAYYVLTKQSPTSVFSCQTIERMVPPTGFEPVTP